MSEMKLFALGINATPTLFINGRRVSAKSYDELKANVEAAFKALPTRSAMALAVPSALPGLHLTNSLMECCSVNAISIM